MNGPAILLTHELLHTPFAKTAHGLVRGPSRWPISAVVDPRHAGRDAGEVLDGRVRGIPVFGAVSEALTLDPRPTIAIVGVATPGGVLPDGLRAALSDVLAGGLTLYNGLHALLAGDPVLSRAAEAGSARIVDLRRPRQTSDLAFWSGAIKKVKPPRLALLGTDCAVGKRTTGLILREACRVVGLQCDMVYTGQSGWLQGLEHGFILDATPNDFVSGEMEAAILRCTSESNLDVVLIEGQSSLRNPSGPCGAELLLSADAKGAILQHVPGRKHFEDLENVPCPLPPVDEEVALIRAYGTEVIAVTLNGRGLLPKDLQARRGALEDALGLPVILPLEGGMERLVACVRDWLGRVK
ncbi:MAG: DUF1611 domain-containing protein [Planctomycetota bacterium]|nr:DUF1611 domain-containing protein [Planctomycetota bacterium]